MKKILAVVLAAAMVFSLAACGAAANATPEQKEAAKEAVSEVAEVAKEAVEEKKEEKAEKAADFTTVQDGKLIMATNAAFPPYEFVSDEDGETIVGIDAEIAALIANELGLELQIEDMEFGSILTAVQTGKVDVGLAGMTVTEERLQNVNFSSTYAKGIQSIIVPEGSEIKTADDLAGHMIGVQESTTGHIYCEDDFGADNITAYANGATAVQALLTGQVDCVVIDNTPAQEFVKANEGLKILDTAYAEEDYAAAISKDNEALLKAFNTVLDAKIADGSVQKIIDKYISAE